MATTISAPRPPVTHSEPQSHYSLPVFKVIGERPKNLLERALSVFADVRAGEGVSTVLLSVNVFLLLAGYSLMKPARDGLILTEGGAEIASYSAAAQGALLAVLVPFYGWLGTRLVRVTLITSVMTFFAATLVAFYVGGIIGLREGIAFYIWIGLVNNFIVSLFWQFGNDLFTEAQGQRLFPLIGVGQSLGAWVGAAAVAPLVVRLNFTPYTLMLAGACVLTIALGTTLIVNARESGRGAGVVHETATERLGPEGGFELIAHDRYLMWIAILIVLLNVVNTTGQYILNRLIVSEAVARFGTAASAVTQSRQFVTAFSGSISAAVNLVGLLLQLFVTARVLRWIGVRGALFVLPLIALVNYSLIAVVPVLAVVRFGKILENSTDYSIQNTLRQALFLPTSREAKYKAKAAIDTFFTRVGDIASAGVVAVGHGAGLATSAFAGVNVVLTVIWLWIVRRIAREHRRRTQ
ncbi:MAG TPA: Npt1/Npt2 family nucleotide transporter [Vicinamibacterales bacterium]|nr:Npt1/Npt2 family nucleotide transporter [Vicinamibacterales bacterium]